MNNQVKGYIAGMYGYDLELQILRSASGYYIGTQGNAGPVSRESVEYYPDYQKAVEAFEKGTWTQRQNP